MSVSGVARPSRWCWIAGLVVYVISFLGSWSIGLYLLSATFVLFALAMAYSFHLIKQPWHVVVTVGVALLLWYTAITFIDDYWLFFPFAVFL